LTFRRELLEKLKGAPRSVSSLARELGMRRGDVEEDLRHALRSATAAGYVVEVLPARCRSCGFTFDAGRLMKPGRCPECRASRIYEPQIVINPPSASREQ
jgi:predicted Zn-ribbon and HTH transcriptional regulator